MKQTLKTSSALRACKSSLLLMVLSIGMSCSSFAEEVLTCKSDSRENPEVTLGESQSRVLASCGQPLSKNTRLVQEPIESKKELKELPFDPSASRPMKTIVTEEWVYDLGDGKLWQLSFRNGLLSKIEPTAQSMSETEATPDGENQ